MSRKRYISESQRLANNEAARRKYRENCQIPGWLEQQNIKHQKIRLDDLERYRGWIRKYYWSHLEQRKRYVFAHRKERLAYSRAYHPAYSAAIRAHCSILLARKRAKRAANIACRAAKPAKRRTP